MTTISLTRLFVEDEALNVEFLHFDSLFLDNFFDFKMTISLTRLFDESEAVETLVFHNGYLYEETKA